MLAKLGAITIGDIWWYLWRGLVWAIIVVVTAAALDIEPSWKLFVLFGVSMLADAVLDSRKRAS